MQMHCCTRKHDFLRVDFGPVRRPASMTHGHNAKIERNIKDGKLWIVRDCSWTKISDKILRVPTAILLCYHMMHIVWICNRYLWVHGATFSIFYQRKPKCPFGCARTKLSDLHRTMFFQKIEPEACFRPTFCLSFWPAETKSHANRLSKGIKHIYSTLYWCQKYGKLTSILSSILTN